MPSPKGDRRRREIALGKGRPSNEELAGIMCVGGGESTKRRREVADLFEEFQQGHCVMVGLKKWERAMA